MGKEGVRACSHPSLAGQPAWGGKSVQWKEQPLVGTSRLLFSTVEGGQTVIFNFQATSSAKLASPALAGVENCTGRLSLPPAFVLTGDLLLFC